MPSRTPAPSNYGGASTTIDTVILLTQLQAAAAEGELREPRGVLTEVHVEPVKGAHVKVQLGSAGLFVRRGDALVAYPLADLVALAAEKCPLLLTITRLEKQTAATNH